MDPAAQLAEAATLHAQSRPQEAEALVIADGADTADRLAFHFGDQEALGVRGEEGLGDQACQG